MKKIIVLGVLFQLGLMLSAQNFENFLNYINNLPETDRQGKVDSFKTAHPVFPLAEDTLAHFIYIGSGTKLAVPGDFSGWDPAIAAMVNVTGTNFWYRTYIFENNARLDYKFVYNGSNWILDPRNPFTAPGGFGNNSELRMPAYIPPLEILSYPEIPHGILKDTSFFSTNLGNSRTIRVYLPPAYRESTREYPVVFVHDGLEYISFAKMNNVIDYLISVNKIQPLVAVFIPPVDRSPEYIDEKQDAFTNFIIQEVMPWVETKYRTIKDPASRAVIGSSAGGNISLWLAMTHPEVFGNAGAFSSYIEQEILDTFSSANMLDLRIYMLLGTYDHLDVIHQSVSAFLPVLEVKAYDYLYEEYPEGHSYGFWRAHTGDALEFFFPGFAVSAENNTAKRQTSQMVTSYPNPVENNLYLKSAGKIDQVDIFDINGKRVKSIYDTRNSSIDVSELSRGVYLVRTLCDNVLQTTKFVK